MSDQPAFKHDTFLYSAEAPEGRLFAAGDHHPGEGWHDHPRAVQAPKAAKQSATSDVEGALAEQAKKFDASWKELTGKHNAAQAEIQTLKDENKDLRGEIASKDEDIRQLREVASETSNELAAANLKLAEQADAIAKFDPDGDGKPGGAVPKAKTETK